MISRLRRSSQKKAAAQSYDRVYRAAGQSLDEAVSTAHDQIPVRPGRDFAVSRIVEWGMQRGGFTMQRRYYAVLIEEPNASFITDD
jgi:hypothetical protein